MSRANSPSSSYRSARWSTNSSFISLPLHAAADFFGKITHQRRQRVGGHLAQPADRGDFHRASQFLDEAFGFAPAGGIVLAVEQARADFDQLLRADAAGDALAAR